MPTWVQLFSEKRLSHLGSGKRTPSDIADTRLEAERDFDRVLFSTPVRRLADKTQVFPAEARDSVRTRLTHSYEASNLARSVGHLLARRPTWLPHAVHELVLPRLPPLLAAAALAHDLGNPPFGHEGERAIQLWFESHPDVFDPSVAEYRAEFENFDGNAQTVRIAATLQGLPDKYGLNLTCATFGALLKYTVLISGVSSDDKFKTCANKKPGYYASEKETVERVLAELGLSPGTRHPLAYLVEACDDAAYAVMDVEDGIRKGVVGFHDLIAFMERQDCSTTADVAGRAKNDYWTQRKTYKLSANQAADFAVQMLRTYALGRLVPEMANAFCASVEDVMNLNTPPPLLKFGAVGASRLCDTLKDFGFQYIYKNPTIREKEARGAFALSNLLDYFWEAISSRGRKNRTFFQEYAWQSISENYRIFLDSDRFESLPVRYRELRLLCDMVAGMTDTYCIEACEHLRHLRGTS